VSEPSYTMTITESERTALAKSLGMLTTKLINAPIFVESPSGGTQAARAVLSPPPSTPPPAAAPSSTPVEPRDRWARDRKGNELPNPDGCVTREVHLSKTEQRQGKTGKKPYLKVTWESSERGFVDANCFDDKLWPWLINQRGKRTTLYLVKSGEYLNVVGVRA
jgi:hypothetical protein